MDIEASFKSNAKLAESGDPRVRTFYDPSMLAETIVLLNATASDPWADLSLAQMLTTSSKVIAFVGVEFVRASARTTRQASDAGNSINQRLENDRIVSISPRHGKRQRQASPIYDEMTFTAEFAAIRGVRAGLLAPRGLATEVPSMLARLQSIWSCSRRRASSATCRRSQIPQACQSQRRRQHVMPLPKPSSCGKSSQAIPVCRTNKMPPSASRSLTLGRPPFGDGVTIGNSGSRAFHTSLLIFFRAMLHRQRVSRYVRWAGFVSGSKSDPG